MPATRPGRLGLDVVFVAPDSCEAIDRLETGLGRRGWKTMRLEKAEDLPRGIGPRSKAVVVVYAPQAAIAMDVLNRLDAKRNSTLVVVITDRVEYGDYFCLMEAGARQFLELEEDPDRILRAVDWAARTLAP